LIDERAKEAVNSRLRQSDAGNDVGDAKRAALLRKEFDDLQRTADGSDTDVVHDHPIAISDPEIQIPVDGTLNRKDRIVNTRPPAFGRAM